MQALPAGRGLVTQLPLFAHVESPRDVEVHALSRPAREFTGDFYFTERVDDTLWLVIGDVAGKGVHAAVIMAMIQEQLEDEIAAATDPAAIMTRLHLALREILGGTRFATVAIARIRDDGRLVIANGGHPPLFIARRDGSIDTIGSTGPVAGLLPNSTWRSIDLPFRRGETLLAYTDGVTEARNPAGSEFGVCGVRDVLAASLGRKPREIAAAIEAALDTHASKREDDVTIIVAQR